jgi:hypothetical protein
MSIARHHAEWLSLIEVSGPFLSLPVLLRVFPQGLDAHDAEHARSLRMAFAEWRDNQAGPRPSAAVHDAWIRFVLTQTLGLDDRVVVEGQEVPQALQVVVPEHNEVLRPDRIVKNPKGDANEGRPRLLIQTYPSDQDLRKPARGRSWKAWPESRMADLLHGTGVRLGLVTNGEHWMLIDAPKGETTLQHRQAARQRGVQTTIETPRPWGGSRGPRLSRGTQPRRGRSCPASVPGRRPRCRASC